MKRRFVAFGVAAVMLTSCTKTIEGIVSGIKNTQEQSAIVNQVIKYTIAQGQQYCDQNGFTQVSYEKMSFTVKFDSSAIYKTQQPGNQADINKLYGFSDNSGQHHQFSARFGWRWYNNALHLLAYVYNNGVMTFKEVGTVAIGVENNCSIEVAGDTYVFKLNGTTVTMPRKSTTPKAEGYKLYPYFGGTETAPHAISIWIKES